MVLAVRTPEGRFDTTPSAQDEIYPGDTLIVLGTREQVGRLEALMRDEEPTDEDPRNLT
jgi:K+/H+ antiporter YhaU regulatory subunit KhtT